MRPILLTILFLIVTSALFSQDGGLHFHSEMFGPAQTKNLTTQWKTDKPPSIASEYNVFQWSQINLPAAYSYHSLALFCRVEVKMERAASFPIKFRLGSVEYVDWLEQKRFYTNLELGQ